MWRWVLLVAVCAGLAALAWKVAGAGVAAVVFFIPVFGGTYWLLKKQKAEAAATEEAPMVSLVLLLREPRYLEARVLAEVLRSAWGLEFPASGVKDEDSGEKGGPFLVGENPLFMANTGTGMFIIHNHEKEYFCEQAKMAEKVPELRQRTILLQQRAWLSIDAMGVEGEADTAAAYVKIARALAELADDKVLALYQPASNRLTPWDAELEGRLRSGQRLDELFEVRQAPVVRIANDDPRMAAAVAEARERWPEFVAAFKARQPGGNYAVKVPITRDDNTEFIWLEVIGLEPEYVHGRLANDPVNLGNLELGDQVEAPIAELNDWTYCHQDDDEPAGLFTVRVVADAYKKQSERAQQEEEKA